jgi:hypothetical protein
MKTIDLEQVQHLETIDPKPLKPWRQPAPDKIDIDSDREKAINKVIALINTLEKVIYSDALAKKSNLGAAAVILDQCNDPKVSAGWRWPGQTLECPQS